MVSRFSTKLSGVFSEERIVSTNDAWTVGYPHAKNEISSLPRYMPIIYKNKLKKAKGTTCKI